MLLRESDFAFNIERFTGFAEIYDTYRPHPPPILLDLLSSLAESTNPNVVIDLGCGTGLSSRFWSSRAIQVIGIEPTDDMRRQAEANTTSTNVSYRSGLSHQTDLPSNFADIVTCSQSLHWMDPQPTFTEVARILRSGGIFAAYDYDLPPTTSSWEADAAYERFIERVTDLEAIHDVSFGLKRWPKDEHLKRMKASGCFRFVKEVVVHHVEEGNAERFVGLTRSQGNVATLLKKGVSEQDLGLVELQSIASERLGEIRKSWYFSSRIRLGVV
jgi:ubiquinone/menaquinone biosynthesis C-methylase UbiE